jgi:hypothetical protein
MSKLFSKVVRPASSPGLYSGSKNCAAADDTRVFAAAQGLSKDKSDGLSEALMKDVTKKLTALAAPLDPDPHELRDLNAIILAHMMDLATGKPTGGKTGRWADQAMADLKTRHVSMNRVRQVIHDCNEWLKKEHPEVHQALKNSRGLGNHPLVVRKLTDRFLAHESEQARAARGGKWLSKAKSDQRAEANPVPPGGLLSGNPNGDVSSAALTALDRRPLAVPDAAA